MNTFSLVARDGDDRVLRTADDRFNVSVQAWDKQTDGIYLHVHGVLPGLGHYHALIDGEGGLGPNVAAKTREGAEDLLAKCVESLGIDLSDGGRWLECSADVRSVLTGLDGGLELRAKAHVPEDEAEGEPVLDLRVKSAGFGNFQVALQAYGRILPGSVSGSTSGDSYNRFRTELARRGVELD